MPWSQAAATLHSPALLTLNFEGSRGLHFGQVQGNPGATPAALVEEAGVKKCDVQSWAVDNSGEWEAWREGNQHTLSSSYISQIS